MVGYQAGSAVAATALIRRVSPMLHRLFAAEVASRAHADDLLQETWLRIHRVRHTYRSGEPVLPWLYAIARHVRIDHYRSIRRAMAREESMTKVPEVAAPSLEPTESDDLNRLLAPLSPSEREVIELLKIVGMSLEEVAGATSCSVGSVKQKAHRAYKKLRIRLRELKVKVGKTSRGALP
jgi:RNA polymerase sigma-70 factor, ECF subfamily